MTQPHENETASPAMLRAEQVVNEVGERFGMWAGSVMTRMQRAAGALNQEANRMDTPGAKAKQGQDTHAMQRAEELVGKAGEYATRWTLTGNMNLRRAMARLREDMEDMWVEAHEIEHHLHEKPHQEPPSEQAH
jgi:hypothetical protein